MSEQDNRDRLDNLVRTGSRRLDLAGFRTFILRGNAVDLAIGIVIGTAFTLLVKSIVADFITPLVGIPLGQAGAFADRYWALGGSHFLYGDFVISLVSFIVMGIVVYYFVVRPMNALMERFKSGTDDETPTKTCPECKSSIPYDATRCAFCSVVVPVEPPTSESAHPA
jgi:large conductance mechanosensitive channel